MPLKLKPLVKRKKGKKAHESAEQKAEVSKKLKMTKHRLRNLRESTLSQEDLEAEKIANKIGKYLKHEERMQNLTPSMRDKVLREMSRVKYRRVYEENSEEYEKYMKAFPLLLSDETKEVELIGTPAVYPFDCRARYLARRLEYLATNACNLQSLTISGTQTDETLDETVKAILCKLENLEKLQILSYRIKYTHLKELCKKLQRLQFVDAWIDFDCQTRFEDVDGFVDSFGRLSFFLFHSKGFFAADCEETLTRMCVQHLPQLAAVRKLAQDNVYHLDEDMQLPSKPTELRHLCVRPSKRVLHATFPNVTHLRVQFFSFVGAFEEPEISPLLQFDNVESLFLDNVPSKGVVDQFLREYGRGLVELRIHARYKSELVLDPRSIDNACPRLRKLGLFKVSLLDGPKPKPKVVSERDEAKEPKEDDEVTIFSDMPVDDVPRDLFSELRELAFHPDEKSDRVRLSSILTAPKLECLLLSFRRVENIDVEDLLRLASSVEQGRLLANLTHFQLASHPSVLEADFCRALSVFTRNASASLLRLTRFEAMFCRSCVDVLHFLAEGEDDAICTDRDRQLTAEKFAQHGDHKFMRFIDLYKKT